MKVLELFKRTVSKLDRRYFYIVGYDALFYLITAGLFWLWGFYLKIIPKEIIDAATPQESLALQAFSRGLALKYIVSLFLIFLILFLIWNFFKYIIYSTILKKRFKILVFGKFIAANLVLCLFFLIPFLVVAKTAVDAVQMKTSLIFPTILFWLVALLYFHFRYIAFIFVIERNRIWMAVRDAFKTGFNKFGMFLKYYSIIALITLVLMLVNYLLSFAMSIKTAADIIIGLLAMAFIRFYLVSVVKNIERVK